MKIITVSGAHSGVGKTRVVETLLKVFKGWSALKVTVLHKGACPTDKNCGACTGLDSPFSVISDEKAIMEKDKDTCRYKKAGAKRVLWLKARPHTLKEGLNHALSKFQGAVGLIIEGTSILKYVKPDLAILVKKKNSALKGSAKAVIKKVDWVLTF